MTLKSFYPGEIHLENGEYINGSDYVANDSESFSSGPLYESVDADVYETIESDTKSEPSSLTGLSSINGEYPTTAFIDDLRLIAHNLRISSGTSKKSSSESYNQRDTSPAGPIIAGAALAFNILSSGVSTLRHGDLSVTMPTSEIGVRATNVPPRIRQNTKSIVNHIIFSFEEGNAVVQHVKIQLTCTVQYNGPEVTASFGFTPDGARSRLMRDTTINIRNPLGLQTIRTSEAWVRAGIPEYPVVLVPIEIRVDRPYPLSNYNWSFNLVLSGMYGLGRAANSGFRENFIRRNN